MTHLAPGIAHISFAGGGLFLVARDAAQRQGLVTEVATRSHTYDIVQVLFDQHRWLVHQVDRQDTHTCRSCGRAPQPICYDADKRLPYCLSCALTDGTQVQDALVQPDHPSARWRASSRRAVG